MWLRIKQADPTVSNRCTYPKTLIWFIKSHQSTSTGVYESEALVKPQLLLVIFTNERHVGPLSRGGQTFAGRHLQVEQVFVPTVLSQDAVVGGDPGAEHEAAQLGVRRIVGDHEEHVEVAAFPHLRGDGDLDAQARVGALLQELVLMVGFFEGFSFLTGTYQCRISYI